MLNEFLKTLWLLRFEKLKKNEEEAAWKYQEILDQCLVDFDPKDDIIGLLAVLVREERMHERLGEELIRICQRTHPEASPFSR